MLHKIRHLWPGGVFFHFGRGGGKGNLKFLVAALQFLGAFQIGAKLVRNMHQFLLRAGLGQQHRPKVRLQFRW